MCEVGDFHNQHHSPRLAGLESTIRLILVNQALSSRLLNNNILARIAQKVRLSLA
jgi:hypothetical protein